MGRGEVLTPCQCLFLEKMTPPGVLLPSAPLSSPHLWRKVSCYRPPHRACHTRLHTLCTFLNKGPGDHGAGCCVCCPSLPTSLRGVWGRGQGQLCKLEDPVGLHSDEEAENTPPPQALLPGEPQQRCHPLALGSHVNSSEKSLNPWLKQAYPSHTHLPHAAQCSRPSTGLGVCLLHYESGDLTF